MKSTITITQAVRRRFILGKQGLWSGRRWAGKVGVEQALRAAESIQVDPVTVVACSHDLVLWGRVHGYKPEHLQEVMYGERKFFEYGGALFIYPMEELPYWRTRMAQSRNEARWVNFAQAFPEAIEAVRQAIRERGPLRSRDLEGKAVNSYRSGKDTGVALYYLWLTGELMSYSREGKERVYDFLENVAPSVHQWAASETEAAAFFTRKAISQWGLTGERDFRNILKGATNQGVNNPQAKGQLAALVEQGELARVSVEDQKEMLYCFPEDVNLLDDLSREKIPAAWQPVSTTTLDEVVFLSPLEYVSARGRAKALFGFEYIWEIYKPAEQRQYGPYTLPVLYGDGLVGRMDAKLERHNGSLVINGLWLEAGFKPEEAFWQALRRGLDNFMEFIGASRAVIHEQARFSGGGEGIAALI
jgi:hypothetical protein